MLAASDAVVVAWIGVAAVAVTGTFSSLQAFFARKQMKPNGGSSMRDAIDRIEAKVDRHGERLAVLEDHITRD